MVSEYSLFELFIGSLFLIYVDFDVCILRFGLPYKARLRSRAINSQLAQQARAIRDAAPTRRNVIDRVLTKAFDFNF